jgi:hypothetical protein
MVNEEEVDGDDSPKKKQEEDTQVKKEKYKLTPGVLVLVDKNRGLCYLDSQTKGYWHQKCVEKAIKDYHKRMELVCISDNSKYFLFCDNFLQTFSVWKHTDMSH